MESPRVRDPRLEEAFEADIEHWLLAHGGYTRARPENYSRELAIDPPTVLAFLRETQPEAWVRLETVHGERVEKNVLNRLYKELENWGTLHVLRRGITDYGVHLDLAYFRPATDRNPEAVAHYRQNRLTVLRQARYSERHPNRAVDLVLFVNGLPVATAELKNPLSGQTAEDAIAQYRAERDPREKLFQFKKRALVHFAVDPDRAFMTTKLAGAETTFLPFNRGHDGGAGNPPNALGQRTAYLWQEVWARDAWLDCLGRFVHVAREEATLGGQRVAKERLIFPRYHQLDVVRRVEANVLERGAGKSYLVQHSAGSGKSNSIAWLAHRLATLHDVLGEKAFHTVVVVSDRRVLDQQLQDTVYQMEQKRGVVVPIDRDSAQLAAALEGGALIVVTTLQKFPFVIDKVAGLADRRFAVIVDEAHSSQTGEAADALKAVLGGAGTDDEDRTYEDVIAETMAARQHRHPNLSFFAFTATPKPKTRVAFGEPADGHPPFHLYSMRQAIEEGFILDVLRHYTTYRVFFALAKRIQDDPRLDKRAAQRAAALYVGAHPHNMAQKVAIIVEHFRTVTMKKIGGLAKAMVVTGSRPQAVRYKREIDRYLREQGYDREIRTLVAFSGTVKDDLGVEQTEARLNGGLSPAGLPDAFAGDEYRVLIVAEKYQTGFDQPLLHTMYVDKRLAHVRAVQTLSRLNRTYPGKEDTFVLDFVNEAEDIRQAFEPFYDDPPPVEDPDPNQLYDLATRLDAHGVIRLEEVEWFAEAFFRPQQERQAGDHARFYKLLDPAVDRARALDDNAQDELKELLGKFVRRYSFLAQVMPFTDSALEKLYAYARLLAARLRDGCGRGGVQFQDEVALEYYRLEKTFDGSIALERAGDGALRGPTEVGPRRTGAELESLSSIVALLNERFGTTFEVADQLFFAQIEEQLVGDGRLAHQAQRNPIENFRHPFEKRFLDAWFERMETNQEITDKMLGDPEFASAVQAWFLRRVYERLRQDGSGPVGELSG